MSDEPADRESEDELAELDGVVKGEDGRLRARMARNAKGGRVPDDE